MLTTMDRMFDDMMRSALGVSTNKRTFAPEVDVYATDEAYVLVFDVPGVRQEDLEVTLDNSRLTVRGLRALDSKYTPNAVAIGRSYGRFLQTYELPDGHDESKLTADLTDGVLTLTVPKLPRAKPVKIQIGSGKKQLGE